MTDVDPDSEAAFKTCVIKSDAAQTRVPQREVIEELRRFHFSEDAVFAVKLALEEALVNAVKHGNKCDGSKSVTVRYAVDDERAVIVVRDEGCGFVPDAVPDPTAPDRLAIPSGRGLMLIRAYMDEVQFSANGCEVRFVKLRT